MLHSLPLGDEGLAEGAEREAGLWFGALNHKQLQPWAQMKKGKENGGSKVSNSSRRIYELRKM